MDQKDIFIYNANDFVRIPCEKSPDILLFCMKMIEKIVDVGKMIKINKIIAEILINPDLISNFNLIMEFLADKEQEKIETVFLLMCSILEDLVVKNE